MKVRIVYHETGSGEIMKFDTALTELTAEAVVEAIKRDEMEATGELCEWAKNVGNVHGIVHGSNLGFMFTTRMNYFGDMIFTGVAYTQFFG
jgi:hypothetical protein